MGIAKRIFAGILSAVLALGLCSSGAFAAENGSFTLGIYFTADLYGKWTSVDPCTGQGVDVNYLKVASVMAGQEKKNDARLLIDGGNSFQGASASYVMHMERGERNPVALSMRYAGYDALFSGSAERFLREETRKSFYNSLTDPAGTLSGTSVAVLQAETVTAAGAAEQEERTAPFLVRSYPVGGRQFRVGVVSLEKAGDWTEFRKSQACDLVVAVAPSGVLNESMANTILESSGLDLVLMNGGGLSGVITLRDDKGKRVPVIRGGGSTLVRTEVSVNAKGSFTLKKSEEIDLAARRSDDGLGALLTPYYEEAQEYGKQKLGVLSGSWDWETDLSCVQSDTMNFIHEAQLWASGANVSISAPQTEGNFCIRQLLEDQWIAPMDRGSCYTIYPNENDRLVVVEMTGAELKDWLEQAAEGYTVEEDGSVTGGKGISQAYGVSYTVCLGNPEGKRVLNLTYQGRPLAADTVLRVAVSESSLAAAKADRSTYPIVWEAVITQGFRQAGGSVTWIIAEYIRSLTEGYRQITPPKPQSRWTVTTTPSGEVMVPVTRLEFVERLYDAVGRPSAYLDLKQTFSDIGGENPAAAWAVQAGIVQGNGKGQFNPDDRISREQAAIMLLRFDLARNMGPSGAWAVAVPYADATEISAWASEAVMWNVIRSYLPDDGNGNFRPQAALTTLELEGALERLGG